LEGEVLRVRITKKSRQCKSVKKSVDGSERLTEPAAKCESLRTIFSAQVA